MAYQARRGEHLSADFAESSSSHLAWGWSVKWLGANSTLEKLKEQKSARVLECYEGGQ